MLSLVVASSGVEPILLHVHSPQPGLPLPSMDVVGHAVIAGHSPAFVTLGIRVVVVLAVEPAHRTAQDHNPLDLSTAQSAEIPCWQYARGLTRLPEGWQRGHLLWKRHPPPELPWSEASFSPGSALIGPLGYVGLARTGGVAALTPVLHR